MEASALLLSLLLMPSKSVVPLLLIPVPLIGGNADDGPHSVVKAESGMPFLDAMIEGQFMCER